MIPSERASKVSIVHNPSTTKTPGIKRKRKSPHLDPVKPSLVREKCKGQTRVGDE